MTSPPDEEATGELARVESVDVTDRAGGGSSRAPAEIPDGLLALRKYSGRAGYYLNITEMARDLDVSPGEDHVHVSFEDGELGFEVLKEVTEMDESNPNVRKVIDNGPNVRVSPPRELLGEYGVGMDVDDYPEDDPYLFQPLYEPDAAWFVLLPYGHASDVFRDAPDEPVPVPDSVVREVVEELGVSGGAVDDALATLNRTLSPDTFEAASIAQVAEPTVLDSDGRRLAVFYLSEPEFSALALDVYRLEPPVAQAVWYAHTETAGDLVSRLFAPDPVPEDHPLRERDVGAVVLSLGESPAVGDAADESVARHVASPIDDRVRRLGVRALGADPDELQAALETLARDADADDVAPLAADLDPVTLPHDADEAEYDQVRVHFLTEGGAADLAAAVTGAPDELAAAVREVHVKQAEQLLSRARSASAEQRRFRREYDAVVVPVFEDE